MKGCPWCDEMKTKLNEGGLDYTERDIDKYEKEYDLFVEATGSDYIPAFMLLDIDEDREARDIKFMVPDDDFEDFDEALLKIRQYL
tara:strand:+ start:70 stop:327 length:258 start_codon:yes stop_codon:yes gene_type:complete